MIARDADRPEVPISRVILPIVADSLPERESHCLPHLPVIVAAEMQRSEPRLQHCVLFCDLSTGSRELQMSIDSVCRTDR